MIKNCEICSEPFRAKIRPTGESRFCSSKCYGEWRSKNFTGSKNPAWKGGRKEITCKHCGKTFYASPPFHLFAKFCSNTCYWESRHQSIKGENNPNWRGGAVIVCQYCGKEFPGSPHHIGVRKYCSKECQDNSRRIGKPQPCENCGTIFISGSRDNRHRFCSHKCAEEFMRGTNSPLWRGGDRDYPETFNKEFKQKIRKRDNYRCQVCGERGKDVHHIDYVKAHTYESNCITLCHSCHCRTNSNREYWQEYFTPIMAKYS
jgi:hypothetical protein